MRGGETEYGGATAAQKAATVGRQDKDCRRVAPIAHPESFSLSTL